MRSIRAVLVVVLVALLAACSGAPPKRIFPPQATLQELRVQPDGQWVASVRIQNFSTVPMRFSRLTATLSVGGSEATRIDIDPAVGIGPGSIEVVRHTFTPGADARAAVDRAFSGNTSVRYQLAGSLTASEPSGTYDVTYQSALDPVPGLPGVLR